MGTVIQGNASEGAVLQGLTAAGISVLVPFGEGLPFDLACVVPDGRILRVQVKTGRLRKGCVEFNASSTDHGRGQRHYRGRADVIAVHVPALARVFIVPVHECPSSKGYLRVDATRNNQQRRVRLAERYALEVWVDSLRSCTVAS